MRAALLAIGTELLRFGHRDTNTEWLSERLARLGVATVMRGQVDDDTDRIASAVVHAAAIADIVVLTGGLGPTDDDRTREALACACDAPLERDEEALAQLRLRFARRGIELGQNNSRQADRPRGADWVPNVRGSAPGLCCRFGETTLWSLPGVPAEMREMFEATIEPALADRPRPALAADTLRIAGRYESSLDAQIADLYAHEGVEITLLGGRRGLTLSMMATGGSQAEADSRLARTLQQLRERLGEDVFGGAEDSLEGVVGRLLVEREESVATAESCTGGMVGERLTSIAGSSAWYRGGWIVYSNALKRALAGIEPSTLERYGAVSEPVARELAEAARDRCGASWGLGITGIAGPGGGSAEKPVGLVHLALAPPAGGESFHWRVQLPGDRQRVRWITTHFALDRLRRRLIAAR